MPEMSPVASLDVRRTLLSMSGLLLAIVLTAVEQTVVGTALPRIAADLGGFDYYSWVFSAFLFTSTAAIPVAGKLSDLYGRRRLIATGILVFLLGTALCGAAPTMLLLVASRAVQGLGAGILTASAFAAIGDLFPPAERGKWQGLVASTLAIASLFGPTLGGYVTDTVGWRWVFWSNLPLGALALAVLLATYPAARSGRRPQIDFLGAVLITVATIPLLLALAWGGTTLPWQSPEILGLFALAGALFVAFAWVERHAPEPVIPLDLFRDPIIVVGLVVITLTSVAMYGLVVYLPLFVQGVQGLSPGAAGALVTPLTLSLVVANIASGQIIARTGRYRWVAVAGVGVLAVASVGLVSMGADSGAWIVLVTEIMAGAGLGFSFPVFTIALQNSAAHSRLGVVTSTMQFSRSIGAALGVALMGSVVLNRFTGEMLQRLPADVESALGPSGWADLLNPQLLVRPGGSQALAELLAHGPTPVSVSAQQVLEWQRAALALAVHDAFVLLLGAVLVALCATLFLRELPLRRSHRPVVVVAEGGAAARPRALAGRAVDE